jgi:hypothetical protein
MKTNDRNVQLADLLDAIQDQSRIMIAFREDFSNKTDAARRLSDLGIPASRVASLLGKPLSHVTSALSKARKKAGADVGEGVADVSPTSGGAINEA